MARSRARRMMGHSTSDDSPTLTERHRMLLDKAMRKYVELKEEGWGMGDKELAMVRQAVRCYANVVALNESGYYPDAQTSIKKAESMSLERVRHGRVRRHSCGGLILVNGMCLRGHDPSKPFRGQ